MVKHAEAYQVGCCDLERLSGLQSDDWDSADLEVFCFEGAMYAVPLVTTCSRAQDQAL